MRDSTRNQILEACDRIKSHAEVMRFLLHVYRLRVRDWPDERPDSPRLWLDFSYATLADKTDCSRRTLMRAIKLLKARGFITVHSSEGERNLYQVNEGAIDRWLQRMPLFEQNEAELEACHPCHDVTGTGDTVSPPPVTPCHGYPCHGVTGSPYMSLYSLPSPSAGVADAASEIEIQTRPATEPSGLPDVAEQQAEDAEREGLLEQLRSIGIAQEYAEAHLSRHTRQKLQAALACLAIDRRNKPIRSEAGYVLGFLAHPQKYGYDLDAQGRWRSSKELAREEKLRRQDRTRDSPSVDPRQAAYVAWDRLSSAQQQAIRQAIQQQHPDISPALLMQRCREQALNITREAPCPKQL